MCAHRGRPAAAPGGRCPFSTDAQIASPRRFLFAATTPPQIPFPTPPSRSLRVAVAGFPPLVPTTPSVGPQSTGEKLGPRGRAWGAESPFPAWSIPGRCCHQRTRPTLPPALLARPGEASRGFDASPGRGGPPLMWLRTRPPRPQVPQPGSGARGDLSPPRYFVWTGKDRVTPGLPTIPTLSWFSICVPFISLPGRDAAGALH